MVQAERLELSRVAPLAPKAACLPVPPRLHAAGLSSTAFNTRRNVSCCLGKFLH